MAEFDTVIRNAVVATAADAMIMASTHVLFRRGRVISGLVLLTLITGCSALSGGTPTIPPSLKTPSTALEASPNTRLGQAVTPLVAAHPGRSGFYPLNNGIEALAARLLISHRAERSIDLQYYLLHADLTGYVFVEQLLKAADRGVRVRMLLDDITTKGHDAGLAALDSHPHIEVRIFNPFSSRTARWWDLVTDLGRVNHRMHNKSITFDNQVTIVGGRNVGDEYFDARQDRNYNDLDLLAIGPVVQEVSQAFDAYWNSVAAVPILALVEAPRGPQDLEQLRHYLAAQVEAAKQTPYRAAFDSSLAEALAFQGDSLRWEKWTLVVDPPEKAQAGFEARRSEQLTAQLRPTAEVARTEFVLVSPYFVPRDRGVEWLRGLRQRGLRVVIVTNSLSSNDVSAVHAGYSRSRKALLEAGVELWEIRDDPIRRDRQRRGLGHSASSLHTKAFTIDRRYLFVGSFNFDPRSVNINTEMGIVVDSPSLAASAVDQLLQALPAQAYRLRLDADGDIEWVAQENNTEVIYRTEPHTSFWRRFTVGFLRLLPIEGRSAA
jgi:putative cardiolipin synthase